MSRRTVILLLILGVIAGALSLTIWSYRNEILEAKLRVASAGVLIPTHNGPIQYAEVGTGDALLSIHGAGGGYDQGLAIAAEFVGSGYRVIAPSRFGYLATPVPADASDAAQADAHAALLDALAIDTTIVLGTSAGARSAIELALRHPARVRALVLLVPATYSPTRPVTVDNTGGSQIALWLVNAGADFAWWSLERIAPSLLVRFLGVPPTVIDAATDRDKDHVSRTVRSVQPLSQRFRGINLDSVASLRPQRLEALIAPTLVITARDDLFNTLPAAEHAARSIPGARLEVLDTGGHLLVGHSTKVPKLIEEFLEAASGGRQHHP